MAREIGISKITLFPLTTDTEGEAKPVYGNAYRVPWAVNFETENEYAEGEYYADNIIETSKKQLAKISVTMEVSSDTPPSLDAKITGKTVIKGGSSVSTGQVSPYHAIAYEIKMDDGSFRRKIIYKVAMYRNGQTNATQEDGIEGQTYTYEGTGIPLVSTNDVELTLDSKEIEALEEEAKTEAKTAWDNFFTAPVLPADLAIE